MRLVGSLLGEVIRQQHGEEMFLLVERVRRQFVGLALEVQDQREDVAAVLATLTTDEAVLIARAFSSFHLINVCEDSYGGNFRAPNADVEDDCGRLDESRDLARYRA